MTINIFEQKWHFAKTVKFSIFMKNGLLIKRHRLFTLFSYFDKFKKNLGVKKRLEDGKQEALHKSCDFIVHLTDITFKGMKMPEIWRLWHESTKK